MLQQLAEDGGRPAISFYRGRVRVGGLTRAELLGHVERTASFLRQTLGVQRGDRVGLLTPNSLELPILLFAIWRAGAVAVPLNPAAPPEEWQFILEHAGACGWFVAPAVQEAAEGRAPAGSFVCRPDEIWRARGAAPPADEVEEAPAIILYTSGTTGRPKGVTLSQRSLAANARAMARRFGLLGTTQMACLPLYHAHALGFGLLSSLLSRGHLVLCERFDPFSWAEVVRAESVAVSSVVPTMLSILRQTRIERAQVPTLQQLLVSSAPLPVESAFAFERDTHIPLIHGWGLSEYTNFACCLDPRLPDAQRRALLYGADARDPSVGPPLEGTEMRVLNDDGEPLGEGERGELWVRGPSRMLGYAREPEASAAAFCDGWLRTGDEGYYRVRDGEPFFYISGRLKEIIIRDGEKFSPLAIERRIVEQLPEIEGRLVVVGFAHEAHGEEVGAYLEMGVLPGRMQQGLLWVIAALPPESRPKIILHGDAPIPRTHTGKVQRRKLASLFGAYSQCRGAVKLTPI
jgi:long-chain acyl-CoA synthetase